MMAYAGSPHGVSRGKNACLIDRYIVVRRCPTSISSLFSSLFALVINNLLDFVAHGRPLSLLTCYVPCSSSSSSPFLVIPPTPKTMECGHMSWTIPWAADDANSNGQCIRRSAAPAHRRHYHNPSNASPGHLES